jgi:hypothetical protein
MYFARPQQSAFHAAGAEELRIPLRDVETRPEDLGRRNRRRAGNGVGCSGRRLCPVETADMFHVKHSSGLRTYGIVRG